MLSLKMSPVSRVGENCMHGSKGGLIVTQSVEVR